MGDSGWNHSCFSAVGSAEPVLSLVGAKDTYWGTAFLRVRVLSIKTVESMKNFL